MEEETKQQFTDVFVHSLENIATQYYNALYKEVKKDIKLEGQDYQTGYQQGLAEGKRRLLENFPMWKIAPETDYLRETVLAGCADLGLRLLHRGQLLKKGWKYITIKSLKMLSTEVAEEEETEE